MPGLDEMRVSFDFEPVLFANVPLMTYDYTAHGDGSEFTVRRNREAFEWVDLLPGKAIDPKSVDLSSEVLGTRMPYPILVAPSAVQVPLHPDGEMGMYRGATAASNTPMILSHVTSTAVDKVAAAAKGPLWSQFYPQQDRAIGRRILEESQNAGCTAVVVTVDQQASFYERTEHDRNLGGSTRRAGRGSAVAQDVSGPAKYRVSPVRLWYTWQYLDEIRKIVKVPLLVKGILTAEDARLCLEHGVDGIIVSNHGGRSMDYGPSTLEVLPEIVAAVRGRVPVITDSGYRRGTRHPQGARARGQRRHARAGVSLGAGRFRGPRRPAAARDRAARADRSGGSGRPLHAGVDRFEPRDDPLPVRRWRPDASRRVRTPR